MAFKDFNKDRRSNGRSGGFNRGGNRSGGFNRGRNDRGPRKPLEMHDVICSKCKAETQVPFKPRTDKPVLCRDCFGKGDNSRGRGNSRDGPRPERSFPSGPSKDDIKVLSVKLDRILNILESKDE